MKHQECQSTRGRAPASSLVPKQIAVVVLLFGIAATIVITDNYIDLKTKQDEFLSRQSNLFASSLKSRQGLSRIELTSSHGVARVSGLQVLEFEGDRSIGINLSVGAVKLAVVGSEFSANRALLARISSARDVELKLRDKDGKQEVTAVVRRGNISASQAGVELRVGAGKEISSTALLCPGKISMSHGAKQVELGVVTNTQYIVIK